jgi:hypothetical protein
VTNNCVGAKNHLAFLLYLITAWMYVGAALCVMVTNSHFGVTSAEVQAWKSGELEKNFLKARFPYMVAFFVSTAIATPSLAILTWLV